MATAIYSALSMKTVRHDVAMTGEITLRGKVLPIGGLREKSMAAYKHGINTVIIPKMNKPDLSELEPEVKEKINFVPVESLGEALKIAVTNPVIVNESEWNPVEPAHIAAESVASIRQ